MVARSLMRWGDKFINFNRPIPIVSIERIVFYLVMNWINFL